MTPKFLEPANPGSLLHHLLEVFIPHQDCYTSWHAQSSITPFAMRGAQEQQHTEHQHHNICWRQPRTIVEGATGRAGELLCLMLSGASFQIHHMRQILILLTRLLLRSSRCCIAVAASSSLSYLSATTAVNRCLTPCFSQEFDSTWQQNA